MTSNETATCNSDINAKREKPLMGLVPIAGETPFKQWAENIRSAYARGKLAHAIGFTALADGARAVRAFEFGARKYAPFDWERRADLSADLLLHAFARHAHAAPERDTESGLEHEDHAHACAIMLRRALLREEAEWAHDARRIAEVPARDETRAYVYGFAGARWYLEPHDVSELPSRDDIVASLQRIRRFNGRGFTVAEHSALVAAYYQDLVGPRFDACTLNAILRDARALGALLHDAHECVFGDTPAPIGRSDRTREQIRAWDMLLFRSEGALKPLRHTFERAHAYATRDEMRAKGVGTVRDVAEIERAYGEYRTLFSTHCMRALWAELK